MRTLERLEIAMSALSAVCRLKDDCPVLVDEHSVLEVPFDGAGEHNTLDVTADELELLNALPVRHASDIVLDDRPGIELLRDVVSRGADDLDAPVARAAIGVSADESRQNE